MSMSYQERIDTARAALRQLSDEEVVRDLSTCEGSTDSMYAMREAAMAELIERLAIARKAAGLDRGELAALRRSMLDNAVGGLADGVAAIVRHAIRARSRNIQNRRDLLDNDVAVLNDLNAAVDAYQFATAKDPT